MTCSSPIVSCREHHFVESLLYGRNSCCAAVMLSHVAPLLTSWLRQIDFNKVKSKASKLHHIFEPSLQQSLQPMTPHFSLQICSLIAILHLLATLHWADSKYGQHTQHQTSLRVRCMDTSCIEHTDSKNGHAGG